MNPTWALISWSGSETGTLNLFSFIIKIGAFTGLSSVMLVLCYAQTRVFFQMAKDGLIWRVFSHLNPRFQTPAAGTIVLGVIIAIAASLLPLGVLGDLVSLGTALAFAIVCGSVIYLRKHNPSDEAPLRSAVLSVHADPRDFLLRGADDGADPARHSEQGPRRGPARHA